MSLRLQRIVAPRPAEFEELFAVCRQAPNYWLLTQGKPLPEREAVAAWFDGSQLPAGCTLADHFVYGIRVDEVLIGVVMVLRGWRYPEQATIGLLLLAERWQGGGYGRAVYREVEGIVRGWRGIEMMRISVIASNAPAFPFWHRLGFVETGERKREVSFIAEAVMLEKPLEFALA